MTEDYLPMLEIFDSTITPSSKQVVRWLWLVENGTNDAVQTHGQQMLDTYFESKESAESFILHGE